MHISKGLQIAIFCFILLGSFIGCTGSSGDENFIGSLENDTSSGTSGSNGLGNSTNGSAQYGFKADLYTYSYQSPQPNDWADSDTYTCGISAYWDPVPYVQYYQIKFEYHGHEPVDYCWGCDFRNQGHDYCNNRPFNCQEGIIYHYGGDPEKDHFVGVWSTGDCTAGQLNADTGEVERFVFARLFPEQKHGWPFISIRDEVKDYEELSGTDIAVLQGEMVLFIEDYVDGWELWVRGVTETQG